MSGWRGLVREFVLGVGFVVTVLGFLFIAANI